MSKEIKDGYDRVTDVLFPFSGLTKVNTDVLKNAAERGTQVHLACACHIHDLPMDDVPDAYHGYVDSFLIWAEGKKFLTTPERFYDDRVVFHCYAG